MKLRSKHYSFLLYVLLLFLASCGITINKPAVPIKTFETSGEYLKEGKSHFDAGRFIEAQRYLAEAIRLDPNNQPAHVLAGVTWVKLGKANYARSEFEKTVEINRNSGDGVTAQTWLQRLQQPLSVAIFPFENLRGASGYNVERLSSQSLHKQLLESGLYSILDERQLSYSSFGGSKQGSRQTRSCEVARGRGGKIAIIGTVSDFQLVQDKPPPIQLGPTTTYYGAGIKVTLQVYATSECRLVDTFSKSAVRRQIPAQEREAALNQIIDGVFQQLALNIHAALM
jgi:tetratricopeptide (TPR) repeat protein